MKIHSHIYIMWMLLCPSVYHAYAQEKFKQKEIDIDQLILEIFQQQTDDKNYEDFYEVLYQLYTNPINLNEATVDELQDLYILTPLQIQDFMRYRAMCGELVSIYELQAIPSFDLGTVYKLLPFVEITPKVFSTEDILRRFKENRNHYIFFRADRTLQTKKGFKPDKNGDVPFTGDPYRFYLRYRNSIAKDFSVGFTLEKDAGEKLMWNAKHKTYFADFISFHVGIYNKGRLKALQLGDYQLQFGQGLILGAGFYIGKGAETITTVKRSNSGIRPYTSVLENGFFRGMAATYAFNKYTELTAFYSSTHRDANILEDTSSYENDVITSFDYTGNHRTIKELSKKNNTNEQTTGANLSFTDLSKRLHVGTTYVYTAFSRPVNENPQVYNQYDFSGKSNHIAGADFSYLWRNFNFFGEAAMSKSKGKGMVGGFICSMSPKLDFAMVGRLYEKNFHSFYSVAFSESSTLINERGTYWGIKIKPTHKWVISAYYDRFYFPWLRYLRDAPAGGNGFLMRAHHFFTKKISMYAQLRYENQEKNLSDNLTKTDYLVPSEKYNYLLNVDYRATEVFTLRSRVAGSNYRQNRGKFSQGFALIQDFIADYKQISLSTRIAVFQTDDYENRIYAYERDVLYAVSIPAYYGKGVRTYAMINFPMGRYFEVWLRYARTVYYDRDIISSGLEEIEGNIRSDVKVQVRYKFK
ncbi:MAG: helix-hairpin-helix domain-containing protein [Cytophagaceae bacterium]|nr:helix-hairpin-helix domain-containing protein [Cytophagaceae bacterium]MDW8455741.1 helix-hairpin-helix domain-containing protein [Cytophagaceae bacterium]